MNVPKYILSPLHLKCPLTTQRCQSEKYVLNIWQDTLLRKTPLGSGKFESFKSLVKVNERKQNIFDSKAIFSNYRWWYSGTLRICNATECPAISLSQLGASSKMSKAFQFHYTVHLRRLMAMKWNPNGRNEGNLAQFSSLFYF